jgi:hypothetical protein
MYTKAAEPASGFTATAFCVKGNSWALFPFPAKYLAAIVLLMEALHIA